MKQTFTVEVLDSEVLNRWRPLETVRRPEFASDFRYSQLATQRRDAFRAQFPKRWFRLLKSVYLE